MDTKETIARDLKRFEEAGASFERTAILLGFVCLFIAIWVRTPQLEMNPGSSVGLSIKGFNVGHAIVFGPIVTAVISGIYLSHLAKRAMLRNFVLKAAEIPES